jgi:hypothetical protein
MQRHTAALLRSGRQRLVQTQALLAVSAELLALITLLTGDVGQYRLADAFGHAAWTCADEADSDPVRALVLIAQSKNARWDKRFGEAAKLARRGVVLCPAGSPKVLLSVSEATALQSQGDIEGARLALVEAGRARDEITISSEEANAWSCPRARQATYALQVGLGANDPGSVLSEVQNADEAWSAGDPWVYGTWAQVRIGAAIAHTMNGEPEAAAGELEPVFDLGPEYRVVTIVGRMKVVEQSLGHRRYAGSGVAANLQERIRLFRAESLEAKAITAPEVR